MGTIKSFPSQLHTVVPEKPCLFPILNTGNICAYTCSVTVGKCWLSNGDVKMQQGTMLSWMPESLNCGVSVVASEVMQGEAIQDNNSGYAHLRRKYVKTETPKSQ